MVNAMATIVADAALEMDFIFVMRTKTMCYRFSDDTVLRGLLLLGQGSNGPLLYVADADVYSFSWVSCRGFG